MPARPLVWNTGPVIFAAGPFALRWYGLLFAMGFFLGFLFMRTVFRREGIPMADLDRLLVYAVVGAVAGARLGHVLLYEPAYYFRHPVEIVAVWKGGLASHGGAAGMLVALYLYARRRPQLSYLWLLDRVVVPVALAGALIRLGNFFNSEILGSPTDVPWAVVFARVDAVPRHPAQLYESVGYLVIFVLLFTLYRRMQPRIPRGLLLGVFLITVFCWRFLVEFVKLRQAAFGAALPLSMGQLLSLPLIAAGVVLVWRARRERYRGIRPAS